MISCAISLPVDSGKQSKKGKKETLLIKVFPLVFYPSIIKNFHIRNAGNSTHRTRIRIRTRTRLANSHTHTVSNQHSHTRTCRPTYVDVWWNIQALNCEALFMHVTKFGAPAFDFASFCCCSLLLISLSWHSVCQVSAVGVASATNLALFWSLNTSILGEIQNWKEVMSGVLFLNFQ